MEIYWVEKVKIPNESAFKTFVQDMANRIAQGHCRYGPPDRAKEYLTKLELELKAYKRTGNSEHLVNIANYCHLENYAPEHPKFHRDSSVGSVARGKRR